MTLVVALMTCGCQKRYAGHPFFFTELHLAREIMQVPHQRRHDGFQAGVIAIVQTLQYRLGDGMFVDIDHVFP